MKNILFIRMDKIGDLVVTLPVDQLLLNHNVTWFITKGVEFVPQFAVPQRKYFSFPKKFSWSNFFDFLRTLKKCRFDAVVVFHAPAWVLFALWFSRIPLRIGVLSKLPSFLFLNRGVRQKRSQSLQHELAYNLDLVHKGLNISGYSFESLPKLKMIAPLVENPVTQKEYIVVHPGMAGSALNWSVAKYIEFIQKLKKDYFIIITGTQMDKLWTDPILNEFKNDPKLIFLNEKLNIQQLLVVLKSAKAVVAPSTGVIHLAASLGTPVFGIYSPRTVETPTRWGPLGDRVYTFMPSMENYPISEDIMDQIQVDHVLSTLIEYLKKHS